MAFLDNIKGIFGGMEKPPELDKTKQALEGLKEQVKAQKIDEVLPKLQSAFMVDLDELNVTDQAKRMEYWGQVEQLVRNELMKATPEYAALENFTNNPTNLPELQKIINDTNPGQAAKSWLEKLPGGTWLSGGIAALIVGWADDMKNKSDDKKDTWLGSQLRKFAGWLGIKEEKKEAPAQTLATWTTEAFQKANLTLDATSAPAELTALGLKDEDAKKKIETALAPNGIINRLSTVVGKNLKGDEKFAFHASDIRLQELLTAGQVDDLVAAIDRKTDSKLVLKEESAKGMRDLLTAALSTSATNGFDTAMAAFKRTEVAAK